MKFYQVIIFVVFGALSAYIIQSSCSKPEYPDNYIETLEKANDSITNIVNQKIKSLAYWENKANEEKNAKDSLLAILARLKKQTVQSQEQITQSIAEDSLNAIIEYRKGLVLLYPEYNPVMNNRSLTLNEIGLGALSFPETHGLRLTVNIQDESLSKADSIEAHLRNALSDAKFAIDGWKQVAQNNKTAFDFYKIKYDDTQSFWYDRFVILFGAGGGYDGETVRPFIGFTVGVKIWGIK